MKDFFLSFHWSLEIMLHDVSQTFTNPFMYDNFMYFL